jgi:hypothetical protein
MGGKSEKNLAAKLARPGMTTLALKGKQSVRTSFKLSEACIHAITIVATQLGIKHRSLFDYLIEDTELLQSIAGEIVNGDSLGDHGIQKSYIISRESLSALDRLCEKLKISRDALIERSVRRLLPIIEKEIESHRRRKRIFELVDSHCQDGRKVLDQIKESVGVDDPIYKAYLSTVASCKQVKTQIHGIISRGKVIEGFDPESLKD